MMYICNEYELQHAMNDDVIAVSDTHHNELVIVWYLRSNTVSCGVFFLSFDQIRLYVSSIFHIQSNRYYVVSQCCYTGREQQIAPVIISNSTHCDATGMPVTQWWFLFSVPPTNRISLSV